MLKRKNLQAFIDVVPFLGDIINEDVDIGVMDSEKFIITQRGRTLASDKRTGDKNTYDNAALSVIEGKKTCSFEDLSGHFAVPVEVTFTPVMEDDGSSTDILIAVVKNIEKRKSVESATREIGTSFEQVDEALRKIADGSQVLLKNINGIALYTTDMQKKLGEIDTLINGIKRISMQSGILAINAGIEAVNAGLAGKGFGVIAREMGNLSKSSDDAAEMITRSLSDIKKAIGTINASINELSLYSGDQADSTQEISSKMNEIHKTFRVITSDK